VVCMFDKHLLIWTALRKIWYFVYRLACLPIYRLMQIKGLMYNGVA